MNMPTYSGKCFHVFLWSTLAMAPLETLNRAAIDCIDSLRRRAANIFLISRERNLLVPTVSPLMKRPFLMLSPTLSLDVPAKRCSAFTHSGLSQR